MWQDVGAVVAVVLEVVLHVVPYHGATLTGDEPGRQLSGTERQNNNSRNVF